MMIDREAALVIKTITNTAIEIPEEEEEIDMCKAIDDMLNDREAKGIKIGEVQMLMRLVQDGDLKVERAAVKAKMTVEQFEKVMESTVLQRN